MLDCFKIRPAELAGLGFDLSPSQLSMVDVTQDWAMTSVDLGHLIDPYGLAQSIHTSDGVPLAKIEVPISFWFTDHTDELSFGGWEEYREEFNMREDLPMLIGLMDVPWWEHRGCGCGDSNDLDLRYLWECWPINDREMKIIDQILLMLWDELLQDLNTLIQMEEWDPSWTDEHVGDRDRLRHKLFLPSGNLRVHSSDFQLNQLVDDPDVLDIYYGLRRSLWINKEPFAPFLRSHFEQTG